LTVQDDPRHQSRSTRPRFSVVVPALNEEAVLGDCLSALAAQTYAGGVELIVVDNGSTDATAAVARWHGARVLHEHQPGVCFARQHGLAAATGEIVVSTDADTTVSPSWLQHIDDQFRRRPEAVAVAGPCVYVDGPWWSALWTTLLFGLVAATARLTGHVGYVTATNLAFYRAAFDGYDTRMTQGGDELDVLRRLRRQGPVVFDRRNPTHTSARRLERGFFYSLFVSLGFGYVLGYLLNRLAKKPVVGAAPAFRTTELDGRPDGRPGADDVSDRSAAPELSPLGPPHHR
jgi:glycosyltransferase involved in cell wall biosynthesis